MPMIQLAGAELHYEVRGQGPPVLFIMGASGDGGHFAKVAGLLDEDYTVITYDRRGNGRSPRPQGWTTTSPQQQADDAAGLIEALGLGPVAVFGTSSGATFALCLLTRHPDLVTCCVLHEPVLVRLYDDPAAATAALKALTHGPPPQVMAQFWQRVAGPANWDDLDAELRERMLATADTFVAVELGTFEDYLPSEAALSKVAIPIQVLVSEHGRQPQHQAARRLAARLGVPVEQVPGTHTPYWDHPHELSQVIGAFLARTGDQDHGVVERD
jgi:pimeloyl-ACP methyl ester carboxylesterase